MQQMEFDLQDNAATIAKETPHCVFCGKDRTNCFSGLGNGPAHVICVEKFINEKEAFERLAAKRKKNKK